MDAATNPMSSMSADQLSQLRKRLAPAEELKTLAPATRELFEQYVGLKPDDVIPHILQLREKAFAIFPYPCIGTFGFLDIDILVNPNYQSILTRLKTTDDTFLDLGCCLAQDIRALIHAGVPSKQLYGADLLQEFLDLGYELFQDKEKNKTTFLTGDIFKDEDLKELEGKMDIVHIGSFLHLFDYDGQVKATKRLLGFLKDKVGCVVLGRQVGGKVAGEFKSRNDSKKSMFLHDEESFRKMWKQVGEETGTNWKVEVQPTNWGLRGAYDWTNTKEADTPERMRMQFTVTRI